MRAQTRLVNPKQLIVLAIVLALLIMLSIGIVSRYLTVGSSAPAAPAANVLRSQGNTAAQSAEQAAPAAARSRPPAVPDFADASYEEASGPGVYNVKKDGSLSIND